MTRTPPIVLVIDDEARLRRFLRAGFELEGFTVYESETGGDAIKMATLKPIDLVILDLGLPDMEGEQVVERLRAWSTVPIIVLSVRKHESEKVRLFDLGIDDYVVKPFAMAEFLARARAAVRRQSRSAHGDPIVTSGPLAVDLAARTVSINGAHVQLSPKEYRLLQVLAQHQGSVVTHHHLLKEVWGVTRAHDSHYLRIFIRKLRRKIEQDPTKPRILLTELGVGYRLAENADVATSRAQT
jgi:two-component system, OmpR family, KDP operon response regulator KdpE